MNKLNRLVIAIMVATIVATVALAYSETFGYWFTGNDAFTQIQTGRIHSFGDIIRIFSEPMMNGTKLLDLVLWFRPVAILSYGIDYAIWGLNPFGYHLTDVLLHILVAVLTFFFVTRLTRNPLLAWIGALIFALHPVHVENVPAIARRHDALAMLFMYLSLFAFLHSREVAKRSRFFLVLSLVAYGLALGSKEIAPILPFLLLAYCGLHTWPHQQTFAAYRRWVIAALRYILPFIIVTIVYVAWRTWILGGIGGEIMIHFRPMSPLEVTTSYFRGLLDPYGLVAKTIPHFAAWIMWLVILLYVAWRFVYLPIRRRTPSWSAPDDGKNFALYIVWLLMPLTILIATQNFEIRRVYVPTIPLALILATLLIDAARAMRAGLRRSARRASFPAGLGVFAIAGFITATLVWYSPLVKRYEDWRVSTDMSRLFLERLLEIAPQFPRDASIHIYDLPWRVESYEEITPHVHTPSALLEYSIESWLVLNLPGTYMKTEIHRRTLPWLPPRDMILDWRFSGREINLDISLLFDETVRHPEDNIDLGRAYLDAGNQGCAAYFFRRYLEVDPNDSAAMTRLGEAHELSGDTDAAEELYLRSLAANDTTNTLAYRELTLMYRAQDRWDEAIEVAERWLNRSPEEAWDAYSVLGWCYFGSKRYGTAAIYFEKSLELAPSVSSYYGVARTYIDGLQQPRQAMQHVREWRDYSPRDPNVYLMLGICQLASRDNVAAIKNIEYALDLSVDARRRAYRALAQAYAGIPGGGEKALQSFIGWANIYPGDLDAAVWTTEIATRIGECDTARDYLEKAIALGLDDSLRDTLVEQVRSCHAMEKRRD